MNKRVVAGGLSGNVLKWYDFAVYGYFAAVIGKLFFPSDDSGTSLILSLAVFAIGFLSRPLGSIIFGPLGDRIGRKKVLVYSTVMMAIPCTLVGLLPTYETLGYGAPILLIMMRLAQGISVGGEFTGSVTYLSEQAKPHQRYFFASFSTVGAYLGILMGSALAALINSTLSSEQITEWGWRIPFLLGSVVGIAGMLLRRNMPDDTLNVVPTSAKISVIETIYKFRRPLALGIGITLFSAINFYMVFVYLSTYMVEAGGLSKKTSLELNTISMVVLLPLILFGGWLADRHGATQVMLACAGGMIASAFPLFWLIGHDNVALAQLGQLGLACLIGPFVGIYATYIGTLFPREFSMSGLSISYNLCFAVFGGTAPMVAAFLVADFGPMSTAAYATAAAAIALVSVIFAKGSAAKEPANQLANT